MKVKIIFICIVAITYLCLSGCTSRQEFSLEITCDQFMKDKHFTWDVNVTPGDSLTVTLCSNPTTSFRWSESAQISDQTVLKQIDHEYEPPEAKNIVGGAGKEIWTFKALKAGTTEAFLEYSRTWEGGEKGEWTFKLTVFVK